MAFMTEKKYQVFVSSTFKDLKEERQDAIKSILDLGHIPAGMELFPAADVDQLRYIKQIIDECDYYVLIVGGRYGSMDVEGVSYTEREYDYAVQTGKVVLAFVHSDLDSIPRGLADKSHEAAERLAAFREKVMQGGRLIREWASRAELETFVLKALARAFQTMPQTGWVRGNHIATGAAIERTNELLEENALLTESLKKIKDQLSPNIDGLADLDDVFSVRYENKYLAYGKTQSRDCVLKLTWRRLFLCVAAKLEKPKTSTILKSAIQIAEEEFGDRRKVSAVNEVDQTTIKIQLAAMGLLRLYTSKTTEGGVAEFMALTEKGRAVFIEGTVVRKVIAS